MVSMIVYKQEQRGRKEAAADRKKRVQLSSLASEPSTTSTPMDCAALTSDPICEHTSGP